VIVQLLSIAVTANTGLLARLYGSAHCWVLRQHTFFVCVFSGTELRQASMSGQTVSRVFGVQVIGIGVGVLVGV
jgi:hypothetical protein